MDTKHKFFIQVSLDRNKGCPVIKFSKHGGKPYTEQIRDYIDDMHYIYVDYKKGIIMSELLKVADLLQVSSQRSQLTFILKHLYDLFVERDGEMVEIDPLIITKDNRLVAAHAKIKIDESSLYR